jgi:hypothetical protein
MIMLALADVTPIVVGTCDWCDADLGLRIFHFEAKRYCCRGCLDAGVRSEIGRPLFETRPFPPELHRLRAQVPHF